MGEIIKLQCDCGYGEDGVAIGMHDVVGIPPLVLTQCAKCRRMVPVRESPHMCCPECQGPVTVVELPMTRYRSSVGREDPGGGDLSGGAQKSEFEPEIDFDACLRCPRCGKTSLAMRLVLIFD